MQGNLLAAEGQCLLRDVFQAAATGRFHVHNRDAVDIVLAKDLCQLDDVGPAVIRLRTADRDRVIFDEIGCYICQSISGYGAGWLR